VSEPTIFGGLSGLHRSIKSRDDTEHGAREALARVIPGHRSVRFLGAEFDPTLDRVGGRRIRGCNSLALSAVDTTDANVAQVQASCLVPTVEIEFLVDSSPSIDYWKAKNSIGASRTISLAFLQLYEVRLIRCDDPPCPLHSCWPRCSRFANSRGFGMLTSLSLKQPISLSIAFQCPPPGFERSSRVLSQKLSH
jgi:hypothetical protein